MNEELDAVDSGKHSVFVAPRNVIDDPFARNTESSGIASDETHVILKEAIHDASTDERVEVAEADVILAINLDFVSIAARSHLTII